MIPELNYQSMDIDMNDYIVHDDCFAKLKSVDRHDVASLYDGINRLDCALQTAVDNHLQSAEKLKNQIGKTNKALQIQRDELVLALQPLLEMSDDTSASAVRTFLKKLIANIKSNTTSETTPLNEGVIDVPVAKLHKML